MTRAQFVLFVLLLFSCAVASYAQVLWENSVNDVYPDNEYIARKGFGKTRAAAEADGAAQIARFFNTQISSSIQITEQNLEKNGNLQSNTAIETETFVQSQMNLSGIRYANDAIYNRRKKEWVTVAYINRNEAWEILKPRLQSVTSSFLTAYKDAELLQDPLAQYSSYRSLSRLGYEPGGTADMLAYAQTLYPQKALDFAPAQNVLAGLPAKTSSALDKIIINVRCNSDFENIITGAIIESLRQGGFKMAAGNARSTNRMEVTIEEGRQILEAGTFYSPRLELAVYSGDKIFFTWTTSAERQGAWDASVAKRQAWNSLALEIKESLLKEFIAAIEGGNN